MPKQTPAQYAAFQDLCRANNLDPKADVWQQKQSGQWIIARTGIEKIQGNNNIGIELELGAAAIDYAIVKCTATRTVKAEGSRTGKKLAVTSFGSAQAKNSQVSYYAEMAEKRAKSRAILMLMGFYELGVYGEDEADDFKRKADSADMPTGNGAGGSQVTSEPPVTPAASSSAAPVVSAGAGQDTEELRKELLQLLDTLDKNLEKSADRDSVRAMRMTLTHGRLVAILPDYRAQVQGLPPYVYASAQQKENIIRLLNHPVITRQEKTKMLLNINRLDEERADQAIAKLNKAIEDREGTTAVAA